MSDPAAALTDLRAAVARVCRAHGLELLQVGFFPDGSGGVAFHAQAEASDDPPPVPTDDGFEDVLRSAREAEREIETRSSIDDLTRRLRDGDGFL